MSSPLPENILIEITKIVMAFGKGKHGEERESLRKLRDLTLLNLCLTSRDTSLTSLPVLYRNVTATSFNSRSLLPFTTNIDNPFIHTRSLTLGISESGQMAKEWQDKFARNGDEASHPELVEIQEDLFKKKEEYLKFLDRGKSVPDALGKKMVALQASRTASILSIIIESMPNLQVLETYKLNLFHFAKIHCNSETGARFSRPLSGLLNLRILKIGESACSLEMTATNCLWLMLFLPSLTHLKIFTEFCSNDERFFGEHQEVLGGKSQVTHLQIEFDTKREQGRNPFGMPWTKNEVLQSLLMVTKDLVELKLCNLLPSQDRSNPSSTLLFLKYIKSSSKSLKFLSLVGEFGINTHRTIDLDNPDGSWFKNIEEPSLSFDALKLISFDRLSLKALHKPEIFLKLKLQLPSLNASHMAPESENWKDANSLIFAEKSFIDWINSKLFPINMKKIFLEEKLLGADGKVMNFEGRKHEWEEARAELIDLCNEKGLEVIVLKEDEQLPFGVMPEPEDLL